MPYISCEEEGVYVKRIGDLIGVIEEDVREEQEHRDVFCLHWP